MKRLAFAIAFAIAAAAQAGCASAPATPGAAEYQQGEAARDRGDFAEAVRLYRIAAEQGYARAQTNLGVRYAEGEGVPQDYAEAIRWYRLAAAQGRRVAQNNIGIMYEFGQGVPKDLAEAVRWYRLAVNQGHDGARERLERAEGKLEAELPRR